MSRKAWSNVFLLLASVALALGIAPNTRMRFVYFALVPLWLTLAVAARRRMIGKMARRRLVGEPAWRLETSTEYGESNLAGGDACRQQ